MKENQHAIVSASSGCLESIQTSNGGVPKLPVSGPVLVTLHGVSGDRQRNLRYHGGPDRAVCLYSRERIEALRAEGHPIEAGSTGENLTISGIDWARVVPGLRLQIGAVVLEVTKPAHPCRNIAGSFLHGDFTRIAGKLRPGWARMYARVLAPGTIQVGEPVTFA